MIEHAFIFSPGVWLGEGKIRLNMMQEELIFFTRWRVEEKNAQGHIECTQEIQVKGFADVMLNHFVFADCVSTGFSLLMDNYAIGKVSGKGLIQADILGWEFRVPEMGFEGFEFYEKQSSELYHVHGEFSTSDDLRTSIHGRIWRQKDFLLGNIDE